MKIAQGSTDTDTIFPGKRTYRPPHTRGDQDFNGNGPDVLCRVERSIVNYNTQVMAEIYMKAEQTKADWTTVEGTDSYILFILPRLAKKLNRFSARPTIRAHILTLILIRMFLRGESAARCSGINLLETQRGMTREQIPELLLSTTRFRSNSKLPDAGRIAGFATYEICLLGMGKHLHVT